MTEERDIVDRMRQAIERIGPPPPTEHRLHPDDVAVLARSYRQDVDARDMRLDGLRIISDHTVPRVPRRADAATQAGKR
jgi:hypothetical protein